MNRPIYHLLVRLSKDPAILQQLTAGPTAGGAAASCTLDAMTGHAERLERPVVVVDRELDKELGGS
jgi:hypothetical protein